MARILGILEEFIKQVEGGNPFNLVLKGGTALSLYYLNHHRESEDLDFDAPQNLIKEYKKIERYFIGILEDLKQEQTIKDYKISKSGFASTNRYHIKLELETSKMVGGERSEHVTSPLTGSPPTIFERAQKYSALSNRRQTLSAGQVDQQYISDTYKTFYTKIDVDFAELPKNLIKRGALNLYSAERIFVAKAVTYLNRREFKDLYDLSCLIKKIDYRLFKKKENAAELIREVVQAMQEEDVKKAYQLAFKNVDLRFKDLKESELEHFIKKTAKRLHILANKLNKKLLKK